MNRQSPALMFDVRAVLAINDIIPEPTTLALLALGGVAMMRRRRAA